MFVFLDIWLTDFFLFRFQFIHNLTLRRSLGSANALKEEALRQQKYAAVLARDKDGLKCELANLNRENQRLKQKIGYLEEDVGERDKQIDELGGTIVYLRDLLTGMEKSENDLSNKVDSLEAARDQVAETAIAGFKESPEFEEHVAAECAAALEHFKLTELAELIAAKCDLAVADFKESAEFTAAIKSAEASARSSYLEMMRARDWVKVNKMAREVAEDANAKAAAAKAAKTSESTSTQAAEHPPTPPTDVVIAPAWVYYALYSLHLCFIPFLSRTIYICII